MIDEEKVFQDHCRELTREVERTVEELHAFDATHQEFGAVKTLRERFSHNPPVIIYTDAWVELAALGLVAGREYDFIGSPAFSLRARARRWLWHRLARFVLGRAFRERKNG